MYIPYCILFFSLNKIKNIFLLQTNMLPYYDFKSFLVNDFYSIIFNGCRMFHCMNLTTLICPFHY